MMKQNLVSVFALLAALTGCSQSQIPDFGLDNSDAEVCLSSSMGSLEGSTRAPMQGSATPTLTARVLLSGTSGAYTAGTDKTNRFFDGTMSFSGSSSVGFDGTKQYYPSDDSSIYLCGLYPSTGWAAVSASSTAVYMFDGKTDVMAAAEQETSKADKQNGSYKTLTFNHLLTNVIIKAKVDTDAGAPAAAKIQALWGNITSIALSKAGGVVPNNQVTVALKTGGAPTASAFSGGVAVGFYKASGTAYPYTFEDNAFASIAIPATETAVAYSLIAPITAKGGSNTDFELLVKTVNNTAGIAVPLSLSAAGDTQGKYCEVTLTFKAAEINAKATIANWSSGGNASGSLQ